RSRPGRRGDVVQADDADLLGDAPPRISKAAEDTDGRQVFVAIDGGDAFVGGKQLSGASVPALEVRLAADHRRVRGVETGGGTRGTEYLDPREGGGGSR